tara:strand:+ start:868 stop:1383 length:516 start_codon:yes stop_codon:yes gene_type:complete
MEINNELSDKFSENLKVVKDLNKIDTTTKSKRVYVCSNDERLNYVFTKKETADEDPSMLEIIPQEKFDYGVVIKKGEPETDKSVGTLDETQPISYTHIKHPEDGEKWYRQKFPNLPEEFYGVIARYTWGQPQTKKSIKNETKKYEKKDKAKGKEPPQGLKVLQGKFMVKFD